MKWFLLNPFRVWFLVTIAVSCTKEKMPENSSETSVGTYSYLALGDSYTIGHNVTETERFPFFTVAQLRMEGLAFKPPRYIATTGWTTSNLLAAIDREKNLGTFDIVSLLIGVNDQYQGLDTAGYRLRFTKLLQKAIELARNKAEHVFVLSIPDYSATPFVPEAEKKMVGDEIRQFNNINKDVTQAAGISYTDITPASLEAATDASLLTSDQLHYSAKEHQIWAGLLVPNIKNVLP